MVPPRDRYREKTHAQSAGLFIWVDLATPEPEASAAFYGTVLGWSAEQSSPDLEMPYWNLLHSGEGAAGMGRLSEEQIARGMPSVWTSYIKVDNCAAAVAQATELGGSVIMPATQVFDAGRMAMLADPTGATFAMWESGTFDGADKFNDPGVFSWNELATRDVALVRLPVGERLRRSRGEDQGIGRHHAPGTVRYAGGTRGGCQGSFRGHLRADLNAFWGLGHNRFDKALRACAALCPRNPHRSLGMPITTAEV